MVWTDDKQKRLQALGFSYNLGRDKWIRHTKDHDEFVSATAEFLYWFNEETTHGSEIRGSNKFPIMDFDALIIFLRAIQSIEKML